MSAVVSVIIMALVTYIPRIVPLILVRKPINNRFIKSFLYYVPYAVLSALTFPAIFWSTGSTLTAVAGTVAAIILAWFEQSLVVVAVVAIIVVYVTGMI